MGIRWQYSTSPLLHSTDRAHLHHIFELQNGSGKCCWARLVGLEVMEEASQVDRVQEGPRAIIGLRQGIWGPVGTEQTRDEGSGGTVTPYGYIAEVCSHQRAFML